jgi:membrane protease YdiL (CAAX protease family)
MASFFHKPGVQKVSRYTVTYLMTAVLLLTALLLTLRVHATMMDVLTFFSARASTAYAVRIWGAFLLFLGYAVFVALFEPYMNKAVAQQLVIKRVLRVAAWQVGIFLLTVLVPLLLDLLWRLR